MTSFLLLLALSSSQDPAPRSYHISAKDLVQPYQTKSANNGPRVTARNGAPLHAAPGFKIEAWATGLNRPRRIAVAPNGDVLVALSYVGEVALLRDADGDGKPELRTTFKGDLKQPYGIAFFPRANPTSVYIANTDAVWRFPYKTGDTEVKGEGTKITELPGGGYNQHWTRNLIVSKDSKKIYITVGSASNASPEPEPRAGLIEMNPDGSGRRMLAKGLRNPVGLDFDPRTGKLWTAVNERDALGDEIVPDYATSVKVDGFYGWPFYYIGQYHDPRLPERPELKAKSIVPDVLLESHCAALGIAFPTTNKRFSGAFVSMHGSWNRTQRSGYKVVQIDPKFNGGYKDFAWGWVTDEGRVWGRPVDVAFDAKGNLLVSDDGNGTIWRVSPQ